METPSPLLAPLLEIAVPLHMAVVACWSPDQRIDFARSNADAIASRSDVLMFGGKKGEAAELFNILARTLACLAFQPGGVRFCGVRWDAHPQAPDPELPAPPPLPGVDDNAHLPTAVP